MKNQEEKTWDIWISGYVVTGGSGEAQRLRTNIKGKTFEEAVLNSGIECSRNVYKDEVYFTRWGCVLYPTEEEARKRFG